MFYFSIANLCHVEPQADGLALLEKGAELPAVKQVVQVTPQSFQNILRKLHLLIVPACQSVGAPVQQQLQKKVETDMNTSKSIHFIIQSILTQTSHNQP